MTDASQCILVVEDDPILKNLLGHSLGEKYEALYASEGKIALEMLEQKKPKIVLLDLLLPNMDGFAILQAIRSRTDDMKNVPVIIVSNLGQDSDREKAKALGATDYLVKAEVSIEEILAKVQEVLSKQPA